ISFLLLGLLFGLLSGLCRRASLGFSGLKRSGHSDLAMRTKHPRTRVLPIYKASSIRSRIRANRNVHRSLEGELRKIRTSLKIAGTSAVNSDLAEAQDHSAP